MLVLAVAGALVVAAGPERALTIDAFSEAPATDLPIADGPGVVAHHETRNGLPTFIWAEPAPPLRLLGLSPEQAARRYLWAYAPRYRTAPAVLAGAPLAHLHDTGDGAIIASFERPEVFGERLTVVMDRQLRAVALTGYLTPGQLPRTPPRLTAETAFKVVVQRATGRWPDGDRKSTRLNSSHSELSRMPSSA